MQDFAVCVTPCKAHDDVCLVNVMFQPQNPDSRNNHRITFLCCYFLCARRMLRV